MRSFNGLNCSPYKYCNKLELTSSTSKEGIPNKPFLKFLSSGPGLQNSVSILFYLSFSIFSVGRKPIHLSELSMLFVKFNSLILGILLQSNMSSKSLSLQFDKSNSRISFSLRPCNLEFIISSVSRPLKVSFASRCSYGSMLCPSSTLSFRRWKMQYTLLFCVLFVFEHGLHDTSNIISLGRSFSFTISLISEM